MVRKLKCLILLPVPGRQYPVAMLQEARSQALCSFALFFESMLSLLNKMKISFEKHLRLQVYINCFIPCFLFILSCIFWEEGFSTKVCLYLCLLPVQITLRTLRKKWLWPAFPPMETAKKLLEAQAPRAAGHPTQSTSQSCPVDLEQWEEELVQLSPPRTLSSREKLLG